MWVQVAVRAKPSARASSVASKRMGEASFIKTTMMNGPLCVDLMRPFKGILVHLKEILVFKTPEFKCRWPFERGRLPEQARSAANAWGRRFWSRAITRLPRYDQRRL